MDSKQKCLFINSTTPNGGLFSGERKEIHPDCNTVWRISPEPFWLSKSEYDFLIELGEHLYNFYNACNLLYFQSSKGSQPSWVVNYLNIGKPESFIEYGLMNRFKTQIPLVIRPDIIPTDDGMIISELDSVPGGIGFTANLCQQYAALNYEVIGSSEGMLLGFADMIRSFSGMELPNLAIVVSEDCKDYWDEMVWFGYKLNKVGLIAYTLKPDDLIFTEDGLWIEACGGRVKVDVVYRFFELFNLKNIPKSELIMYLAKKQKILVTPPFKTYLEEKSLFALLHHHALKDFWLRYLGKSSYELLSKLFPKTWILDPTELPPQAIIPDLSINSRHIGNWMELAAATKRDRELVIKPSGFSDFAWGSRGVSVGHDLSTEAWELAIKNALDSFPRSSYILQRFYKGRRYTQEYYDFYTDSIQKMDGRVRLCPYYFVVDGKPRLSGILATICPADKKIIHGMVDSIMVPCAVR